MKYVIFYIDDEVDLVDLFAETYASEDFEIHVFTEPQKLLQALEQTKPNLVLIDFRLPGMSGDRLAEEIDRKLKSSVPVPKVLITGDLRVAPSSLFMKVFSKPYDPKELQSFLDSTHWRPS